MRLADYHVTLLLPDHVSDNDQDVIVYALNNLNLRARILKLVNYELRERKVFRSFKVTARVEE